MAVSIDHNRSGSTLFVEACLSDYIGLICKFYDNISVTVSGYVILR